MPAMTFGERDKQQIEREWDIVFLLSTLGLAPEKRAHRDNILIRCVFHPEESASLSICVNPASAHFGAIHCFGCQKRGHFWDVLLTQVPGNFRQVKEWAAHQCGIVLDPDHAGCEAVGWGERVQRTRRWFAQWAARELGRDERVQAYLRERGVSAASVERFQLGLVPERPDLSGADQPSLPELQAAGIMGAATGGEPYHRFRDRLLIPIRAGREILGFTGRALAPEPPKWLDTAQTSANPARRGWKKYLHTPGKRALWGLDTLEAATRLVFLAEGPFDALLSAQEGVPALALLGTGLTSAVESLAGLLPHRVGLCLGLDADPAGQRAVIEGATRLMERGFPVSVMRDYAGAKDAAEFIGGRLREGVPTRWREHVLAAPLFACLAVLQVPAAEIAHPMTAPRAFHTVLQLLARSDPLHRSLAMAAMADCLQARDPRCPITATKLEYYMACLGG